MGINIGIGIPKLGGIPGDPTKTLDQNFLLSTGSAMATAAVNGPVLTYVGNGGVGGIWNENGLLVQPTNNEPRYDHDPANSNVPIGILSEGAGTNEVLQSEDFTTTWTESGSGSPSVVSPNTNVAPDGTTTADTLTDDDGAGFELVTSNAVTVGNSETWCASLFVLKDAVAKTTRFAQIRLQFTGGITTRLDVNFDTSTGEVNDVVTVGSGVIVDFDAYDYGDWWRVWIAGTNDASGNTSLEMLIQPAVGANADLTTLAAAATGSIVAWGAQIEEAAEPSSYMPTTTTAVSRTSDFIRILQGGDVSWHNATEGTWFAQFRRRRKQNGTNVFVFRLESEGQPSDLPQNLIFGHGSNDRVQGQLVPVTGGDVGNLNFNVEPLNVSNKVAYAYAEDDCAGSFNGAAVITDGTADISTGYDELSVGSADNLAHWRGHIERLQFFNVRKPNAFLIEKAT